MVTFASLFSVWHEHMTEPPACSCPSCIFLKFSLKEWLPSQLVIVHLYWFNYWITSEHDKMWYFFLSGSNCLWVLTNIMLLCHSKSWVIHLRAASCCWNQQPVVFVLFQTHVANRRVAECPLVDKACNINTQTWLKGIYKCRSVKQLIDS